MAHLACFADICGCGSGIDFATLRTTLVVCNRECSVAEDRPCHGYERCLKVEGDAVLCNIEHAPLAAWCDIWPLYSIRFAFQTGTQSLEIGNTGRWLCLQECAGKLGMVLLLSVLSVCRNSRHSRVNQTTTYCSTALHPC